MTLNHLKDNKANKMDAVCRNKKRLQKDSTMVRVDEMLRQDMLGFASKFPFQLSYKEIMSKMHKI